MGERGPLVTPGAAVHHRTLDRVNAINDSLKNKKNKKINTFEVSDIVSTIAFFSKVTY